MLLICIFERIQFLRMVDKIEANTIEINITIAYIYRVEFKERRIL